MCRLNAYLPADAAVAIHNRLTSAARTLQGPAEPRTLTQLRADIFTVLLTTTPAQPEAGTAQQKISRTQTGGAQPGSAGAGIPDGIDWTAVTARAMVIVPALTLLGHDEEPAELESYGPIPATTARRLAAHAPSFTRLLTHPETGAVLSSGRAKYKVPADLRRWIQIRDRTCRFPGCNTPAAGCEVDHTKDRAAGGTTDHCNLACFCRKHTGSGIEERRFGCHASARTGAGRS